MPQLNTSMTTASVSRCATERSVATGLCLPYAPIGATLARWFTETRAHEGLTKINTLLAQPMESAPEPRRLPKESASPTAPADSPTNTPSLAPKETTSGTPLTEEERSWSARVSAGDFDGVVLEAQTPSLEATLSKRSIKDLVALSEAARYAREPSIAREALLALRKRFLDSPQATDAAFFLGRLENRGGDLEEAIRWYDKYLEQAAGGRYEEQATGRKMVALSKSGQDSAAAEAARAYLERWHRS